MWEKHLEALYARKEQQAAAEVQVLPLDPNEEITAAQVEGAIKKMKTGKAADEFGLKIEHFKLLDQTLIGKVLAGIFTGCLHEDKVPTSGIEASCIHCSRRAT